MGFRPLTDEELAQSGLTNETPPVQEEAGTFKPLSPKQVEALKLLTPGSPAYELSEKYKEAWGLDADSIGKRIQVKDETGLPDFVLDRRPETEKKAQAGLALKNAPKIDWEEVERDYPVTGNFLGAHMPVGYDDIDNLKQQEGLWKSLKGSFTRGVDIGKQGRLATRQMYGDDSAELEAQIRALQASITGVDEYDARLKGDVQKPDLIHRVLMGAAEMAGQQSETFRGMSLYGTLGLIGGTVAALAEPSPFGEVAMAPIWARFAGKAGATAFGAAYGGAKSAFNMEAGNAWLEYKDMPGMDPDAARVAATLVGIVNAGVEMGQISALLSPFKGALAKMGVKGAEANRMAMKQLLQRPGVMDAFKGFARNYGDVYLTNVSEEVIQQLNTQAGGVLGASLSGLGDKFPELGELAQTLLAEAQGAAESFALLPVPGAVWNFAVDIARAERATRNAQLFQALGDTATASKVRNRLPKAFREFVDRATREGSWEKVYISAGAFDGVFGQDAPKVAEDLGVKDEYEEAKATGGEIAIDTATYAEKLAPTQAHQNLVGDLRLKEGEMTPNEAQEFLSNVQAERDDAVREAQEAIAKDDEWGREVEAVRQEVRDQLVLNGRVDEEADADALVYASWVNSLAQKVKKTPLELHSSIGLRVQEGGGAEGLVLNQPAYHGSPHRFDKFTLDKIGTGEGAQAYGWGLYFAGNKEVAKYYRDALSPRSAQIKVFGKPIQDVYEEMERKADKLPPAKAEAEYEKLSVLEQLAMGEPISEVVAVGEENGWSEATMSWLKNTVAKSFETYGQLYKVEIPDDDVLLDWDKPLDEQNHTVFEALRTSGVFQSNSLENELRKDLQRIVDEYGLDEYDALLKLEREMNAIDRSEFTDEEEEVFSDKKSIITRWYDKGSSEGGYGLNPTGDELYAQLISDKGSQQAASEYLNSLGIKGIRYLDQMSRSEGEGTYNYVIFDDEAIQVLQTYYQDARGQIALSSGKNVISLFKSADASTFIHEMGHLMLQTLEQFATLADADPQLVKDWQATREFLNLQEGETLASLTEERRTEAHEKFARTFEAYLMTGEAPTVGLKRVFRQFREWLVNIYKEVRALDTGVTPEIKAVFDRMLGADDEIAEAEALARYNRDVQATEGVELTEEEAKQYESLKEEAEAQARETLTARLMKPLERLFGKDKKAEYEKKRREYENEAREAFSRLPAYRILALLGESKKKGGLKFDRGSMDSLEEFRDAPREESTRKWFVKGGLDPEAVAIEYGYTSASEMFLDLLTAPDLEVAVRQEAQARLDAEFDPKVDPAEIQEAAEKAVRNGHRLELLAIERLILSRAGKQALRLAQAKARVQAARLAARKALEGKKWKDAGAWKRYVAAERRAAKAVERAILKGDMDEALRQKDIQILNAALATESLKAKRESARMVKFLKKYANRGRKETFGVDPRHLEQIDALLERFEFRNVSEEMLKRRESLLEFIATEQELGIPVSVPESILEDMRVRNYANLTFAELEDLHNLVRAISKAGQDLRANVKAESKQRISETVEALKQGIEKQKVNHPEITSSDPNKRLVEKLSEIPGSLDAALMKAQALLLMLDGTKGLDTPGIFIETFWRPFAEAEDVKRVMLADYSERISKAINSRFKPREWGKFLKKRFYIQSLGFSLTGEQIFCVYMNLGTETNKVRLMEGKEWTEAQIAEIVGKLDKRALDLGQDIHDIIETLWPLMVQLDEDLLGYAPKKEEAVPVVTQHGTYRGGYYPLASDFGKGVDIHTLDERAEALYKSQPAYQAMTRQGAHKARAKHADYQVRLDLRVLKKHIEEVVHDLAFRRATVDARRILRDKELRTAIAQRVGREGLRVLTDWLKDTARPPASATDRISRGARWLRYGTTTAMLCLKWTVLVLQGLGWFNTAQVMGWRTLRAMYMYYLRPHTWVRDWKFVMDKSAFMVERNGIADANVREVLLDREYGKNPALIKEIGAAAFNFADGIVTIPTWLEGYRIGLEKYGGDEERAVGYADDIVRQSQGGSGSLDMASLQRTTSEWKKAFTMFYQYFNVVYNLLRRSGHRIDGVRNWGQFGGSLMLLVVLPAIAEGLFRDDDTPEEGEWGKWAEWVAMKSLTYGMGSIPVARDLTSYSVARWTGIGYGGNMRLTPLASPIESVIRTGRALFDEDKDWWDKSKQITETGAYLVPYPMQAHTTAWNIIEYLNGDDPDWDWSNLVARKPRSRR